MHISARFQPLFEIQDRWKIGNVTAKKERFWWDDTKIRDILKANTAAQSVHTQAKNQLHLSTLAANYREKAALQVSQERVRTRLPPKSHLTESSNHPDEVSRGNDSEYIDANIL